MDKFVIEGGRRLKGEVEISGAKNAALPALAATLLATGPSVITRLPDVVDIHTMGRLIGSFGATVEMGGGEARMDTSAITNHEALYDMVKTMRASVLVLGPLVARYGRAKVSLPGGCAIGARPINLHIEGLRKMGASVELEAGYVAVRADRLRGARIYFDIPTVTGTENLMMAASLAKGTTVLENAAQEPEIANLAGILASMGARIYGAGDPVIEIEGVDELRPFSAEVIPDRIETGTYLAAAAITQGDVLLRGADASLLTAVLDKFREAGVEILEEPGGLRVRCSGRLAARDLRTKEYPGFPTDMQAQFMAAMTLAEGTSVIQERIFENRFMHVAELLRMGADITESSGVATVRGVRSLNGADVMATDLRASASLVIAGLAARGITNVHRIYHLDRGYSRMERKLAALGASVTREAEQPAG